MSLDPTKVHHIRTSGLTDAHLAREYRKTPYAIWAARTGRTHKTHPTPPDLAPRQGGGRNASPQARPARVRRPFDSTEVRT